MVDHVSVAADDGNFHPGYGQNIPGVRDYVLVFSRGQHLLVRSVNFLCGAPGLGIDVGSVIDEGPYRDLVDQLGDAASMVIVIVGQQDVVDFADARALGSSKNPVGVAAIVVRPTRVNEQRLPGWSYEQCGLAAFDIDEVNP
jgi:hypothetical protein